jgi:hypothetical protein
MPTESKKQRGAMFAAKAGNSTLGIPQKVGADFIKADKGRSKAQLAKLPLRKGAPPPAPTTKKG